MLLSRPALQSSNFHVALVSDGKYFLLPCLKILQNCELDELFRRFRWMRKKRPMSLFEGSEVTDELLSYFRKVRETLATLVASSKFCLIAILLVYQENDLTKHFELITGLESPRPRVLAAVIHLRLVSSCQQLDLPQPNTSAVSCRG